VIGFLLSQCYNTNMELFMEAQECFHVTVEIKLRSTVLTIIRKSSASKKLDVIETKKRFASKTIRDLSSLK